jgi:Leucine-rich repeat (LRR) protein
VVGHRAKVWLERLAPWSQALTSLDIGWNKLTELPLQLSCLTKLVHLEASYNLLLSIPEEVGHAVQGGNVLEHALASGKVA